MPQPVRREVELARDGQAVPHLGLVCITSSTECRYHTLSRGHYLKMDADERECTLRELYWQNLSRLNWALFFCARTGIELYRVTPALFPMSDGELGQAVLEELSAMLSAVARRARRLGVRVIVHPEAVALNAANARAAARARAMLEAQGRAFDLMGLARSPWAAIIIHGGEAGREEQLVEAIGQLPAAVRKRLCLENDEWAWGAADVLRVCRRAKVPMVFDAHHHLVKEKLGNYEHPSVGLLTAAAGRTWANPDWQIVHLANGLEGMADARHSHLIRAVPRAYADVPWVEVEARGKERAIEGLRRDWARLVGAGRASMRMEDGGR